MTDAAPESRTICAYCGKAADPRMGFCWQCAIEGAARAAKRTVRQHFWVGVKHLAVGNSNARFDFAWAWERFTHTGDYAPGGEFSKYL